MYIWRIRNGCVLEHMGISIGFVKIEKADYEYVIFNESGVVATLSLEDNLIIGLEDVV